MPPFTELIRNPTHRLRRPEKNPLTSGRSVRRFKINSNLGSDLAYKALSRFSRPMVGEKMIVTGSSNWTTATTTPLGRPFLLRRAYAAIFEQIQINRPFQLAQRDSVVGFVDWRVDISLPLAKSVRVKRIILELFYVPGITDYRELIYYYHSRRDFDLNETGSVLSLWKSFDDRSEDWNGFGEKRKKKKPAPFDAERSRQPGWPASNSLIVKFNTFDLFSFSFFFFFCPSSTELHTRNQSRRIYECGATLDGQNKSTDSFGGQNKSTPGQYGFSKIPPRENEKEFSRSLA